MSAQKKELSKLCLTGFILSAAAPILAVLNLYSGWLLNDTIRIIIFIVIVLAVVVGLILSIVGVITAAVKRRRGKGFGIAGIIMPCVYVLVPVVIVCFAIFAGAKDSSKDKPSDLGNMAGNPVPINTEYDVSQYRLAEDSIDYSNITVSRAELKEYADSRLGLISNDTGISITGSYQSYAFFIIRSDCFEEWAEEDSLGCKISYPGYATLTYEETWEFMGSRIVTLYVYKDPSDKFIIITNCNDYKVISDFFG